MILGELQDLVCLELFSAETPGNSQVLRFLTSSVQVQRKNP